MNASYQQHKTELVPTSADIEGPFYKAGAPFIDDNFIVLPSGKPAMLDLGGKVVDTNGEPIAGAVLDFWQANPEGDYDLAAFNYRGKVRSDTGGWWTLHTNRPGDYKISEPGQPDEFRCAHIHVKLTAPGFAPLTTQLYFAVDAYNATDHWFNKSRVIGPDGRFDFVLTKKGN